MIINRQHKSAIWAKKAWHVRARLDFEAMQKAADYFIGCHSFKAFCASGHNIKNFEREISHSKWCKEGEFLIFDVIGHGFLYNMVRIMVGSMVDVAKGRFEAHIIKEALEKGERDLLGITAPAHGLYLMEVFY